MLTNLLDQISSNELNLKDQNEAYRFFYSHFVDGNIEKLYDYEVYELLQKLGIGIEYIFNQAANESHNKLVKYVIKICTESQLDELRIEYSFFTSYGKAVINKNIELVRFFTNLMSKGRETKYLGIIFPSEETIYSAKAFLEFFEIYCKNLENVKEDQELIDKSLEYNNVESAFIFGASHGNIKFLEYLLNRPSDNFTKDEIIHAQDDSAFVEATKHGKLEVMDFLLSLTTDNSLRNHMIHQEDGLIFRNALYSSRIEVVKFIVSLTSSVDEINKMVISGDHFALILLSDKGDVELLNFIYNLIPTKKDLEKMLSASDFKAFGIAAINGHVEFLKCLIEMSPSEKLKNKMINTNLTFIYKGVSEYGHLDVLKFLESIIVINKEILKIIENCELFKVAASNGHIEIMKYFLELPEYVRINDKSLGNRLKNVMGSALKSILGDEIHSDLFDLASIINNYKAHIKYDNAFLFASINGKVDTMKYLIELTKDEEIKNEMIYSPPEYNAFCKAAESGRVVSMKYLVEITKDFDTLQKMLHANNDEPIRIAAQNENFAVVSYLMELMLGPKNFSNINLLNLEEAVMNHKVGEYIGEVAPYNDWSFIDVT